MPNRPILEPGQSCWRLERADRAAFLVDGAAYFSALRAAATKARHSILILGWDIDSRMRLVPEGANDGLPEPLGEFLNALAKRSRALKIYVLNWDYVMLYAPDRETLPRYKLGWRTHRRLRFELDGAHPVGGSHHQKVVVVDDALAFVGGLDLTHCRWDTPEHRPDDPRRMHPEGDACPPFHDVQMAVDGAAAAALGELARERWRRATGHELAAPQSGSSSDPWPDSLAVDITDVRVGISRTEPGYESRPEIQEIKQLHLRAIAAARRGLYIENQYFSSATITDALAERLKEPDGPELALVSRNNDEGWLEEFTIGILRARMHQRLRDAVPRDRYGSFYPSVPGLGDGFLNVHSKVLVVDDEFLTIGSANLNNRSMGFDTECNLAIEARGDERIREAIRGFRHRLLAEHLGKAPEDVAAREKDTGSLLSAIDALRGEGRSLELLEPELPENLDKWIPDSEVLDPERPIEPERLAARLMPSDVRASILGRVLLVGALLAFFVGLGAAWRWTELGEWLAPGKLATVVEAIKQLPGSPFLVLGAYVLGSLLVVPVTAMIAVTVLVFGPWLGLAYAFTGSVLGATVTYLVGQAVGRETLRRVAGSRLDRLSRALGRRGILAIVTVRILPVAPFTVVNLVAGATHISLRDFIVGTVLGLAPGIIAAALFIDRILAAIRDPGAGSFAVLGGIVAAVIVGMALLRRSLRRRHAAPGQEKSGGKD